MDMADSIFSLYGYLSCVGHLRILEAYHIGALGKALDGPFAACPHFDPFPRSLPARDKCRTVVFAPVGDGNPSVGGGSDVNQFLLGRELREGSRGCQPEPGGFFAFPRLEGVRAAVVYAFLHVSCFVVEVYFRVPELFGEREFQRVSAVIVRHEANPHVVHVGHGGHLQPAAVGCRHVELCDSAFLHFPAVPAAVETVRSPRLVEYPQPVGGSLADHVHAYGWQRLDGGSAPGGCFFVGTILRAGTVAERVAISFPAPSFTVLFFTSLW